MEFRGFIFTKEEEIRDFFSNYGYQINNDSSIKTDRVKKYCINNNWILSSNYNYIKLLNQKEYINRSKKFAKILYSSDRKFLKFDYLENGRIKKQIMLVEGEIKYSKGLDQNYKSKPLDKIFFGLIKEHFGLNSDFMEPKPNHFINENKREFKTGIIDIFWAIYIFKGLIMLAIFPILFVLLMMVFFETLLDGTLKSAPTGVFVLFLLFIAFAIYLIWEIWTAVKNYFLIKNRVLNDDLDTLPNKEV